MGQLRDIPLLTNTYYGFMGVLGFDFEQAVVTVQERLNWNNSFWCYISYGIPSGCFSIDQVRRVLTAYTNLAAQKQIDAYSPSIPNKDQIVQEVAARSGESAVVVLRVLDELYYAMADGTLRNPAILDPATAAKNLPYTSNPPSVVGGAGNLFGDIGSVLKYGAIGIAAAVVLYYGTMAVKAAKVVL